MKPVQINLEEGKFSHSLQTQTKDGEPVIIPVIDSRDGKDHRVLIDFMVRNHNRQLGSKYLRPNQYNKGGVYGA